MIIIYKLKVQNIYMIKVEKLVFKVLKNEMYINKLKLRV